MKREKIIGLTGAVLVHVVLIAFLLLAVFVVPTPEEESGIPVMLGDDFQFTEVASAPVASEPEPEPVAEEQDVITQDVEETVAIPPKAETKKKTEPQKVEAVKVKKTESKPEAKPQPKPEVTAEQKAQEQANKLIAGAFGKGQQMGATTGTGQQGSTQGNSSSGAATGSAGYGSFDLGGRSLGTGGLPRPVYNVQDEGRVVVNITVNPSGRVVSTSINPKTNTANPSLRKAAEEAAKKAVFNEVNTKNNQSGTITYFFSLR